MNWGGKIELGRGGEPAVPEWKGWGKDCENLAVFLMRRCVFQLYFLHLFVGRSRRWAS